MPGVRDIIAEHLPAQVRGKDTIPPETRADEIIGDLAGAGWKIVRAETIAMLVSAVRNLGGPNAPTTLKDRQRIVDSTIESVNQGGFLLGKK